ncbi:MAG: hypothetical protein LBL07_00980 [Tannerella sp.]|nr:hypothetical protein [Tannerella sp.]
MKNKSSIFAAFKPKNILMVFAVVAFFIAINAACYAAAIKGYQPLVGLPHCKVSKCSLARMGEDSLLLCIYFNFSPTMPKNGKYYGDAKYSNIAVTPTERNAVSIEKFNIEKSAKNKAYFFILSNGLYDRFSEFCKNYHSDDPHRDCLEYLIPKV